MKLLLLIALSLLIAAKKTQAFLPRKIGRLTGRHQQHTILRSNFFSTLLEVGSTARIVAPLERNFDATSRGAVNSRHSASDWLYNIKSVPQSGILQEILSPVLAVAGWSFIVAATHKVLSISSNSLMRKAAQRLCISGTAHGFLVSALGLLLVFRTNSSYQKFYEGRKIWESILNISRNLSRMIKLYSSEVGSNREQLLLNLIAAFPYLLRQHIRPGCLCESPEGIAPMDRLLMQEQAVPPVDTRYEGDKPPGASRVAMGGFRKCWVDKRKLPWCLFRESSLERVARARNRPLWVCDELGKEIMKITYGPNFTSRERLTMLGMVSKLSDALGQCERIRQTAVPLNYARHALRSLTLWLFTLPFVLVKDVGLVTVPATTCTAWLLYGIYQIGYSIEDPFQGSLRLSILCDAIRCDVLGSNTADAFESSLEEEDLWENEDFQFNRNKSDTNLDRLDHTSLVPPVSDESVNAFLHDTSILQGLGSLNTGAEKRVAVRHMANISPRSQL